MGRVSQRLRTGNDLDQFLGDVGLALAVVADRELIDHIADMRAPCSLAAFSSSPRKICVATLRASKGPRVSSSLGSYSQLACGVGVGWAQSPSSACTGI